jgi:hypothetical protein
MADTPVVESDEEKPGGCGRRRPRPSGLTRESRRFPPRGSTQPDRLSGGLTICPGLASVEPTVRLSKEGRPNHGMNLTGIPLRSIPAGYPQR